MDEPISGEVQKGSSTPFRLSLQRTPSGVTVCVYSIPAIEEFMRSASGGEVVAVNTLGRYWQPTKEGNPLTAYVIPVMRLATDFSGNGVSLDRLGQPLIEPSQQVPGREQVNLSIMRLVGISEGSGIAFKMRGVYSLDELRKMRDRVIQAARNFYIEYLQPVDVSGVLISSTELKG